MDHTSIQTFPAPHVSNPIIVKPPIFVVAVLWLSLGVIDTLSLLQHKWAVTFVSGKKGSVTWYTVCAILVDWMAGCRQNIRIAEKLFLLLAAFYAFIFWKCLQSSASSNLTEGKKCDTTCNLSAVVVRFTSTLQTFLLWFMRLFCSRWHWNIAQRNTENDDLWSDFDPYAFSNMLLIFFAS